jgi:hypothetical protein
VVGLGWKPRAIAQYLAKYIYNARISHARTRTRWVFGSYRLGMVEDLPFSECAKRIPTLKYVCWSWLETAGDFPVFG